jgi:hypothetical protein
LVNTFTKLAEWSIQGSLLCFCLNWPYSQPKATTELYIQS